MRCGRGLVAVDRPKEETAEAGGISRPRQRNPILVFGRLTGLFMNGSSTDLHDVVPTDCK